MKKVLMIMIAIIGFGISANAQGCVKMYEMGKSVGLSNDCNRPIEVSVSWTDAGGRAQSRNITVPAWDERTNAQGWASVNVGSGVSNVRISEPRRVVPRR